MTKHDRIFVHIDQSWNPQVHKYHFDILTDGRSFFQQFLQREIALLMVLNVYHYIRPEYIADRIPE